MRVVKIIRTCFACPSQWEGEFSNGDKLYIRYRWGYLSVRRDSQDAVNGEEIFGEQVGDGLDGVLRYEDLKSIVKNIEFPEEEIED